MWRSPAGVALLLLAALAFQLVWMDPELGLYDESIVLYGADRVLHGRLPYRDFWTLYPPGSFYAVAAVFSVFGETAFAARVFDAVVKTAIVGLVFVLVRRFGRPWIAFAAAVLSLGLVVYLRNYGVPLFGAIAFGLAAMALVERAASGASPARGALGGASAALALLFRHDLGTYVLVAAAAFLWLARRRSNAAARVAIGRVAVASALGLAALLVPALAWLLAHVAFADVRRDLFDIPLGVYAAVRALPFPSLADAWRDAVAARSPAPLGPLIVYLPVLATIAGLVAEWRRARRRSPHDAAEASLATPFQRSLILLNVLFFAKGWVRVSPLHMGASLVTSVVVVAAAAARVRGRLARQALAGVVVLGLVGLVLKPIFTSAQRTPADGAGSAATALAVRWGAAASAACADASVPRLRCLRLDPDRAAVARFLLAHGSAGRRIYVGVDRHDKLFASDIALYFAAEAVAATRWHDLHPGVQTTEAVQREMLAELEASAPAFVVLDAHWEGEAEPNESARRSGVTLLDDWIKANYAPVFRAGEVGVLAPRRPR